MNDSHTHKDSDDWDTQWNAHNILNQLTRLLLDLTFVGVIQTPELYFSKTSCIQYGIINYGHHAAFQPTSPPGAPHHPFLIITVLLSASTLSTLLKVPHVSEIMQFFLSLSGLFYSA